MASERVLARQRDYCRAWRLKNPEYQRKWRAEYKAWKQREQEKRQPLGERRLRLERRLLRERRQKQIKESLPPDTQEKLMNVNLEIPTDNDSLTIPTSLKFRNDGTEEILEDTEQQRVTRFSDGTVITHLKSLDQEPCFMANGATVSCYFALGLHALPAGSCTKQGQNRRRVSKHITSPSSLSSPWRISPFISLRRSSPFVRSFRFTVNLKSEDVIRLKLFLLNDYRYQPRFMYPKPRCRRIILVIRTLKPPQAVDNHPEANAGGAPAASI